MADAVDRLTREYLDLTFAAEPVTATAYGAHAHDDRLDDLTEANLDEHARRLSQLRQRVLALEVGNAEDAADRDALAATIADGVLTHEVERPWRRNPFQAATAIPASVLLLIARDFAPLADRLGNATLRLEAAPRFLDQAKALLDEPCPALWRRMAVAALAGGAEFLGTSLAPLAAGLPIAGRLQAAADKGAAALREFAAWLEGEHAARFPDDAPFAIGEAPLARKLREVHCFDTTPGGFAAIGQAQIAEISQALGEQAARIGDGHDGWPGLLDRIKSEHPTRAELLTAYQRELERLEQFVFEHDLATNPRAAAQVEATPEFLRPVMGYAAYFPAGPFDAFQQGYFWVTPPPEDAGLRDHSWASIPAISAHEGYPGHHLQMCSVNRIGSLTRRAIRSPVMIEGWGLYTEQLMHDVGYYDDRARLLQLSMRLFRALRVSLDMRLHAGEVGYDEAVAEACRVGHLSEPIARSEVARYTMTPTQPFSYLVGALELERLRAAAQARLGDAFRLRAFHDRVLSYGHMPPPLVRRAIEHASDAELGLRGE